VAARTVDESFLALPLSALTEAALTRAVDLGCEHADIRVERIRTQMISLRDARPESFSDGEDLGLAVRVVHEGTWGFAAGVVLTAAEAVRLAEEAVVVATVSASSSPPSRSTPPPSGCRTTRSTRSRCRTARRRRCSPRCRSG
jgi:TldD protein